MLFVAFINKKYLVVNMGIGPTQAHTTLKRSQSSFELCTCAVQVLFQFSAAVRVTAIILGEDCKRVLRKVYSFGFGLACLTWSRLRPRPCFVTFFVRRVCPYSVRASLFPESSSSVANPSSTTAKSSSTTDAGAEPVAAGPAGAALAGAGAPSFRVSFPSLMPTWPQWL
eukprot:CAMPEP_0119539066 /NCGR_PEP_ID=MMETSP1344-20130328/51325_1 /TAXON_ID=236787 /ORGANISM="Florenciella parvula, Strain CCMP2471" /LENGTH=168 /DNA_ID=CAMNT_0007582225 /DNA_START=415 /DNA_END=920 /DNA_ORIENTATION=+